MSAYCFFDVREITDPPKVAEYQKHVAATVERYGGRYAVLGGKVDPVEGDWQPVFPVIVEFASLEQAHRWYDSPEYRPLRALRLAATRSHAVFIEGHASAGEGNHPATRSPADVYDELFVPALFAQWGPRIAQAARIAPNHHVLDVACGTGVLACAAAEIVGPQGIVVGLDASEEMLAVARRKGARVEWRHGRAEALPFPDASFDACASQFGLMFFEDRAAALREMMRVLRPGGRLAVAVCDSLDHSPGYAALADLLQRLFGEPVANAFRAPFVLGNRERLLALCSEAGIAGADIERLQGTVRFASIDSLVSTERACVWTLGGLLDDAQFARLKQAAEVELRPFVAATGRVEFAMPALVVTACKA